MSVELLLIAATDARLAWKILSGSYCFRIKWWCSVSRIWCCIIDMMRSYFVPIILSPRTNNKNAVVSIHRCNDQLVHQSRSISHHPPLLQSDNECLRWTWWCHYPSARRKKHLKQSRWDCLCRRFCSSIPKDRIIGTLNNEIMVVPPRRRQRGSSMSIGLPFPLSLSLSRRGREEFFRLTNECRIEFTAQKSLCVSLPPDHRGST